MVKAPLSPRALECDHGYAPGTHEGGGNLTLRRPQPRSGGIPDDEDRCPKQPKSLNSVEDLDGCADRGASLVQIGERVLEILQRVEFAINGDTIQRPHSFAVLDAVASALKLHPDIVQVEAARHTDDAGPADMNRALPQRRADAQIPPGLQRAAAERAVLAVLPSGSLARAERGFRPQHPAPADGAMEKALMNRTLIALPLALSSLLAAGCGHSEQEWKAQLDKYNQLQNRSQKREAELEKELADAKQRVEELEKKLADQGADISKMSSTLEDREKALAEYKARAKQLEAIQARFDLLRKKLEELVKLGLEVQVRRNRMVISLPGDVLFDSGKDTLSKDGQQILKKISDVIRGDKSLVDRDYQVAGHTDSQPYKSGPFQDNWGLSLMRARAVLLFLIGKEGQLPTRHWSAAGFADTDPIASNNTPAGKQKNRRCDLIVLPDVDEMLDLTKLATK
ncbi:OmpA family protein [Sorangium sp. So ce1000]|uniref:OmpA family protein n=2 Tax=unclassified Sorangium TaxID=2621164 RepID=UPI003F60AF80